MTEYLRNNPITLRTCILYEFVEGKPVYESFNNMCRKIGNDAIDYVDFEYWFSRFGNGKFDLNHDRSLDPKTRTLSDMPIHILEKIVNELDSSYRFVIRRVSKNFQYIIDSGNPGFKKIRIQIGERRTYLYYDDKCVAYEYPRRKSIKNDDCVVEYPGILIQSLNYQKLALDELAIVLKNPKLQLDEFEVKYSTVKYFEEFESMLKSLNRKIHLRKVTIITRYPRSPMAILPCLETGILKEIVIDTYQMNTDETKRMMDRIVNLEQVKNSEMLTIITSNKSDFLPIEGFLDCRRFTIQFNNSTFKKHLLKFTKSLLKSTVLEVAIFNTTRSTKLPLDLEQLGRRAIKIPDRPDVRRFRILESNEFFEIEVRRKSICIKRTS